MTLKEFNRTKRLSNEEWVENAKKIHGDKYDYSITMYKTARTKLKIICPIHGVQEMLPHHHLKGHGCGKCGRKEINKSNGRKFTQEIFLEKVKHIEGLSFEKTVYKSKRDAVIVTCHQHGDYETKAEVLLKGCGCPKCKSSEGEKQIRKWLQEKNIVFMEQMGFPGCNYKKKLLFDFYIPSMNLCIEYDGEQHYRKVNYWGGEKGLRVRQIKDKIKNDFCKEKNIKLLRISYICNIIKKLEQNINNKQ